MRCALTSPNRLSAFQVGSWVAVPGLACRRSAGSERGVVSEVRESERPAHDPIVGAVDGFGRPIGDGGRCQARICAAHRWMVRPRPAKNRSNQRIVERQGAERIEQRVGLLVESPDDGDDVSKVVEVSEDGIEPPPLGHRPISETLRRNSG